MDTQEIVDSITQEIERLEEVKRLLTGDSSAPQQFYPPKKAPKAPKVAAATGPGRRPGSRVISEAGRKAIALAQKKRWALSKATQ